MKNETWGAYSVRDHTFEHPFAADVLLYDRLVVPVPPAAGSAEHALEWERWKQEGWQPDLQQQLLEILGERVVRVPWDVELRAMWAAEWQAKRAAQYFTNAFGATGDTLLYRLEQAGQIPAHASAVNAVATYRRLADLEQAVGLHQLTETTKMPAGEAVAVVGRELLIPDVQHYRNDEDLLQAALDLSKASKRRRQAYWEWQDKFLTGGQTDYSAIRESVSQMADLLADERRDLRREKARLTTVFVLTVAGASLTVAGAGPIGPIVLGGAFVSVAQFAASELIPRREEAPSPAALLYDANRQLGWKPPKDSIWEYLAFWRRFRR